MGNDRKIEEERLYDFFIFHLNSAFYTLFNRRLKLKMTDLKNIQNRTEKGFVLITAVLEENNYIYEVNTVFREYKLQSLKLKVKEDNTENEKIYYMN